MFQTRQQLLQFLSGARRMSNARYFAVGLFSDPDSHLPCGRAESVKSISVVGSSYLAHTFRPPHLHDSYESTAVASPGLVSRRGKAGNYIMGHSRWTSGPGAATARWL